MIRPRSSVDELQTRRTVPASADSAPPPSGPPPLLALLDHSLLQFLLILVGVGAFVAAGWNAPRHREIRELERRVEEQSAIRLEGQKALEEERRWYDGIETDPRVESELLQHVRSSHQAICDTIEKERELSDEIEAQLKTVCADFAAKFTAGGADSAAA